MKTSITLAATLCMAITALPAAAEDYLTFLSPERGYTEVTSVADITDDAYYILAAAENSSLIVGLGAYADKPSWASQDTKALRYKSADSDPLADATNYFTIERSGNYIGLRNIVYSADLMQTHDGAGFMYVNTFTDRALDEWSRLIATWHDGYWLMESGKYPLSGGDRYSGYLGPWNNSVAAGEPIALNRKNTAGDEAGRYRIFRIARSDFEQQRRTLMVNLMKEASDSHPVDATWLITNPSFESGDTTGWTCINRSSDNSEFGAMTYGLSGKEGGYLMNAYQWWASSLGVTQTVSDVPSGRYELTALIATWANREVYLKANIHQETRTGTGDNDGIAVTIPVTIGSDGLLTISAGSSAQWWVEGHEEENQTFFKLEDVRLSCKGLFLDGNALPLPNDNTSRLLPGQWYYYTTDLNADYRLFGNISDMVYSTDGEKPISDVTTQPVDYTLTLPAGRVYFMTPSGGNTLLVKPDREQEQTTFTATALNVDGLPQKILGVITINEDGPGSDGTKLISKYLAQKGYDFIGVSEDFNYHGSLKTALDAEYDCGTLRATLSLTSLSIPFDTDGLNLFWKRNRIAAANETWTQWSTTTDTDGNQYVKKGFRHYDMTIDDSLVIDVYVLHMDAGDPSVGSRQSQWQQLAEAINSADSSRPKIILGDTNSRWTREDIKGYFVNRLQGYTFDDAWVKLCLNGNYPDTSMSALTDSEDPHNYANYEVVDKIIYLNPKTRNSLKLTAKDFRIEQDYTYGMVDGTDSAKPLGDHKPVVVTFSLSWPGAHNVFKGDVNRDGLITVTDVMATVDIILGFDTTEPFVFDHEAADMSGDGTVTVTDAMKIVDVILSQ